MNSLKDKVAVSTHDMHVILGASGNTGSIVADSLLSKGKKVRVVGRDAGRLQRFVRRGAEAFTGDVSDAVALTKAFRGARAAYLLLPPITSREDQERESDAIAKAVTESGLRYAVYLSSYGAHVPEGTEPVTGLHSSEQKLNAISDLNVLHLRAAYFMENNLAAIGMIQGMGIFGDALLPDLKLPMIATRDVGPYAARSVSWSWIFLASKRANCSASATCRWRKPPRSLRAASANRMCITSSIRMTRCSRC